jgi:hypothetical protein
VLIDFASTTQTWEPDKLNYISNYFGVLRILLDRDPEGNGFHIDLVWKHYGDPDDWDPVLAFCPELPWDKERVVAAKNMFPYILSGRPDALVVP